jgi:hypothetical protein
MINSLVKGGRVVRRPEQGGDKVGAGGPAQATVTEGQREEDVPGNLLAQPFSFSVNSILLKVQSYFCVGDPHLE